MKPTLLLFFPLLAFSQISGITHSESATTSIIQWTTVASSGSSVACSTATGGPYTIPGVDDGVQTAVTAHYDIVAGLRPSTPYFCEVTSGAYTSSEFSFTTNAAPTSTRIAGISLSGGETRYNAQWPTHYVDGDTLNNAVCGDGNTYLAMDDTHNWDAPVSGTSFQHSCGSSATESSNQSLSTFTSGGVGSLVNQMTGFLTCNTTAGDGLSAKEDTLFCLNDEWNSDVLFMHTTRQAGGPNFARTNGGLLKSPDHGATWANWVAPSTFLANGAPPSPITSNMLGSVNNPTGQFSSVLAIMYQPGGGISPRVDGQDAYIYWTVPYAGSVYLMRVPRSKVGNLSGADYEYFTAAPDVFDTQWSSSSASAASIYSNPGYLDTAAVQHLETLNRYVMFTSHYTSQPSASEWIVLEAAHPWGPWTAIYSRLWPTQGYVDVRPLASSVGTAQLVANANAFQILFDGDYTTDMVALNSTGMYYQLHSDTMTPMPYYAPQIRGQATVRGQTTVR